MLFDSDRLLVIAGPCSLENSSLCHTVAEHLVALSGRLPQVQFVFKGSYDKANRTSLTGDRGPGMDEGLKLLDGIRRDYNLPVLTDVHLPQQCAAVAEVCAVLQIPAFLCRQTDLLVAAAETGKVVNVKKGQFLSPQEMEFVVCKLRDSAAAEIWQTERGTTFGYQNLVVDMRGFKIMQQWDTPTIFDATHSVQLPGAAGGKSGGQREFVAVLAYAALAAGANGIFMETHPDPANAVSDAASQLPLGELAAVLEHCVTIWHASRTMP